MTANLQPSTDLLEDLCTRFILNVPAEELESFERLLFLVEQAHWFYEDFSREKDLRLRSYSLKEFVALIFRQVPGLQPYQHQLEEIYWRFNAYKQTIPTMGAIILEPNLEKCLLVKGWKAGDGWGFPTGKINKDEADADCAVREVLEETGFDVGSRLKSHDYIEIHMQEKRSRLYIIQGVNESTPFAPIARKEIGALAWHVVNELPMTKEQSAMVYHTEEGTRHKFFRVYPYIKQLRRWIKNKRREQASDEKMVDADPEQVKQKKQKLKKKGQKGEEDKEADLSEEDLELKKNLELMLERAKDSDAGVQRTALDGIAREIRESTTSMTSVPKPLKFLRSHYKEMKDLYESIPAQNRNKPALADIISVMAITSGKEGDRESLRFRLMGSDDQAGSWGHEYVRNLAGEISAEFQHREEQDADVQDLLNLVSQIVPYHMSHNAEPDAVDLLLEEEEDAMEDAPQALRIVIADEELREELRKINSNSRLSEMFLSLARDLDVMEPKSPEEVYKSHLTEGRAPSGPAVDSARQNLASTFVNAFVNAGFGQDKLMTVIPETDSTENVHWIFKNKDHGKTSATASLGMVTLWDVEGGLPQIDKYLYSRDNHVVAGALLAVGITNCGVQDECDPAYALLCESVNHDDPNVRIGAIMGLGLAYAGTQKAEVQELLVPLVTDTDVKIDVAGFAALSLGLVFTSTCNGDAIEAIIQALMMRGELELSSPFAKFLALGLGLLFLGRQEAVEPTVEVAKTVNERISKYAQVTLESCAYAGTGNVLKVQQLLAQAGEHIELKEDESWKAVHQSSAVLGLGLIGMAEDLGNAMAHRALEHLLQYGDTAVRQAVPLTLALLNVSSPSLNAVDTLSRLSHDADIQVAQNAVLALGIVGGGTNNARLAGLLRGLGSYYYKEPTMLFLVRIAQGLVHMGKGLFTLNPYHTDNQLASGVALAGILAVLHSCLDLKATIGGSQYHHILYFLTPAMKPRMLMTVDKDMNLLPVSVRVGQAVDVVAQAGRPKTISGFQTHTTPVLLSVGERAELATQRYLAVNPVLEGIVILQENPEYIDSQE
ncbi:hypothetical protein WJX79_010455 [Trebouxia sp. C0005]